MRLRSRTRMSATDLYLICNLLICAIILMIFKNLRNFLTSIIEPVTMLDDSVTVEMTNAFLPSISRILTTSFEVYIVVFSNSDLAKNLISRYLHLVLVLLEHLRQRSVCYLYQLSDEKKMNAGKSLEMISLEHKISELERRFEKKAREMAEIRLVELRMDKPESKLASWEDRH